eukprot:GFUD01036967.1.p1 GENE.GFUD01036967.1~~GFUD01036967.1.p1  ORF type:complete len:248 (-),score=51.31 GFUD01036967.1:60-803(-)
MNRFPWKHFFCFFVFFKGELVSAGCCTSKVVNSGTSDIRDGAYTLNGSSYNLPVFCKDACVYTKDGTTTDDLFCFGDGDLDSECFAPLPDPTAPQGAPLEGGGGEGVAPPGGYYYNSLPGNETRALTCGEALSLVTEDRSTRLDLADMQEEVPASYNVWSSSKLRFDRIDGESTGDVLFDHLVGIFATADNGAIFRLDVKAPTDPSTTAATARLKVTSGDGTACTGNVEYGTEYALFSEDGTQRLDI